MARRLVALWIALFLLLFSIVGVANTLSPTSGLLPRSETKTTTNKSTEKNELSSLQKNVEQWEKERLALEERSKYYQNTIDNFPELLLDLKKEIQQLGKSQEKIPNNLNVDQLEQRISQLSSKSLETLRQVQLEQDNARDIIESVNQIPQRLQQTRRLLQAAEQRLNSSNIKTDPHYGALSLQLEAEINAYNVMVTKLELEQLSATQRQELSRLRIELFQKQYEFFEQQLSQLRQQFFQTRQETAQKKLDSALELAEKTTPLPNEIQRLIQTNAKLSLDLNNQTQWLNDISLAQQEAASNTLKVRQALNALEEQAKWLSMSTGLGDALRLQLSRLPGKPKPQKLDNEIANIRLERLNYENLRYQLNASEQQFTTQRKNYDFTGPEWKTLNEQLKNQHSLLNSLLSNCDTLLIELTNLKIANNQLTDALNEVGETSHRYFFWVADVEPITFNYPIILAHALSTLLSQESLGQLASSFWAITNTHQSIGFIFAALLAIVVGLLLRKRFFAMLEHNANRVGKVTLDNFMVTVSTTFWSIIMAMPFPLLWAAIGFGLQNAWDYPIAISLGKGVNAAAPILWLFMMSASFSHPQGLFITHFNWSKEDVLRAMRYYRFSIWVLVPLIMLAISLDTLNDREFASSLGRLAFILLCVALFVMTLSLKRAHLPLYLDRNGCGDNAVNKILWAILLCAPCFAALATSVGYLRTSQELLGRLEASVAVLLGLLLVYYVIRRWMLIQRRRIAFERTKQRRAERLAQRAKNEPETSNINSESGMEIEEPIVDLDVISAQSLWLIRSILTLVGVISLILLWSELHSAFSFLENIRLWSTRSVQGGVEITEQITLASILIAILVILITFQLVHNLPALLELTILQHIELTPGTGYAISTVTKYIILFIGAISAFSLIGVDWSTLQWLIAALGVGLGFGLQEIFANFISGLILLFEKPIRINDTVTIRDLTGTVTQIKTRATTIVDWDNKEIIVPNKAFITEQFVNWSLSNGITRIVLTVPASIDADSEMVATLLKEAAHQCPGVLETPSPDVFLVDIQEGIQLFELRIFAAEMSQRMPIRNGIHQLILKAYKEHGLELPFPPFQANVKGMGRVTSRRFLTVEVFSEEN